ncbi:helix-turn-helix domain-containing protein [Endozoicomonas numazuensis]|uniref:helix-turn-helix domain-containing protein n=1 Tax=Endozoicomonas numazuensis TaxID=1137799 RepID=UPI0005592211|nr:helix-turn-helix transcriptional regulator [Endozoicomonas numazuensis]
MITKDPVEGAASQFQLSMSANEVIKSLREDKEAYFPHDVVGFQVQGFSLITAWRKYKKLSQEQLADKMGISQSAMAQIENRDSTPQLKTLERVAEALGIQVEQLQK